VDSLLPPLNDGAAQASHLAATHSIFGEGEGEGVLGADFLIDDPAEADSGAASSGYDLARGSTSGYLLHLGWPRGMSITQEFGTVPGPLVLRGLAIERAEWLHAGPQASGGGCRGTARGAHAARGVFFLRSASWQRRVVRRGVRLAEQAVRALAEAPEKVPLRTD